MIDTVSQQRRDIAELLARRPRCQTVVDAITKCVAPYCGVCGDACPLALSRRVKGILTLFEKLQDGPRCQVDIVGAELCDDIRLVKCESAKKAVRRELDRLPNGTLAVGSIGAVYNTEGWSVRARLLLWEIEPDVVRTAIEKRSEVITSLDASRKVVRETLLYGLRLEGGPGVLQPKTKQRDYYEWLSQINPGGRFFRYGLDRHFNVLTKLEKVPTHLLKRKRPYPKHLVPYQYGSHHWNCNCNICRSRRG